MRVKWNGDRRRRGVGRVADTEHSNSHICVREARPSGRARCGAGAGYSAKNIQSRCGGVVGTTEVVLSLNPLTGKVAARFAGISDCHAILQSGLGSRV